MAVNIRKAKLSDLSALVSMAIGLTTHECEFDPLLLPNPGKFKSDYVKYFRRHLKRKNSIALIAKSRGRAAGYALLEVRKRPPFFRERRYLYIHDLFVPERYRRRGVGSALINETKKIAAERNTRVVELSAYAKNKDALRFYRSQGFRPSQVEMRIHI